jgi:hypothetical protein
VLLSFVTIGIIVYHTASMPFIITILVLFYALQKLGEIDKNRYVINLNFLLLLVVATVSYWMFIAVPVFRAIVGNLFSHAPTGILTKSVVETPLMELFNYLQYSPLLLFILFGVLAVLKKEQFKDVLTIFVLLSLLLVPVTFPGPALLLNKLAGNFNLNRFGEYSFLFNCIAAAAGFYAVFYKLGKLPRFGFLVLFLVMAFLVVSNDFTASDNPLVKRPFYTYYLTENELISMGNLAQMTTGYLMADYISCRYLDNSVYADKTHVLETDWNKQKFLLSSNNDILLIRKEELSKRPLKLFVAPGDKFVLEPNLGDTLEYLPNNLSLWETLENYNAIYDSGPIIALK